MVFAGRVQWAKAGSYSLIKTRTANLRVFWLEDAMPPDVFIGRTVCGAGRMKTYDGGARVHIVDAVPMPAGREAMKKFMELVAQSIDDPTKWVPDLLDRIFRRRLTGVRDY